MNKHWWSHLFGSKPKPTVCEKEKGKGPLLGLSPPEGHRFHVSRSSACWAVRIVPEGEEYYKSVALGIGFPRSPDPRNDVYAAAKDALNDFRRKELIRQLEGFYPPKRIS